MPPEFFQEALKYKSYIFPMISIIAFFLEKNYIYDISNSKFVEIINNQFVHFFEQLSKNKKLYTNGMNPNVIKRKHEILNKLASDTKNMTSIQDLPEIYYLQSNKLIIYQILKHISSFSREYIFYMKLIR